MWHPGSGPITFISRPVRASQTCNGPGTPPEAKDRPSGEYVRRIVIFDRLITSSRGSAVATSQERIRPDWPPVMRVLPSGEKVAAVELIRLVNAYGVDPQRWNRNAPEWIDAVMHVPRDILHDAVGTLIRRARSGDHLPRPGDILDLCIDAIAARQRLLEHARTAADPWPQWMAELWGPLPDGPRKRAEALRQP